MNQINAIPDQIKPFILPIAAAIIAILGVMYMFGAFSSEMLTRAKGGIGTVIVGAILATGGVVVALNFLRGIGAT